MLQAIHERIRELCQAHPDAPVVVANATLDDVMLPLTTVLHAGRRVTPNLFEGFFVLAAGDDQPPMRAERFFKRVSTNTTLPLHVQPVSHLLSTEKGVNRPILVHSVRFEDGEVVLDAAEPST